MERVVIPALSRLLELARKATPGPWYKNAKYVRAGKSIAEPTGQTIADVRYRNGANDAAYIAALSPELVAALVKVAESAEHYRLHQALCVDELPRDHRHCDYLLMDDALREALDELRRVVGGETL